MLEIHIPGYKTLRIEHLIMDYNGTIAIDGQLIPGVKTCLNNLAEKIELHILTADTFGNVGLQMKHLPCKVSILSQDHQDIGKLDYVKKLGSDATASIGNGRIDRFMLKESALGIAVILGEGAATEAILSADVVCTDIVSALELLIYPLRLIATLRS